MKYEFIGTGNMASAIIKGMINANEKISKDIFIYDIDLNKSKSFAKEYNLNFYNSIDELGIDSDYIFLAVKPNIIEKVINDIKENVSRNKNANIISVAAGKDLNLIKNTFGFSLPIIRVLPNVNALVGEGITGICVNEEVTLESLREIKNVFNSLGEVMEINENLASTLSAVGGAAPAFAYLFIEALARAGVRGGFDKKTATKIATQVVIGSGKMVSESEKHPWELIDTVCSPGGTTIEGIKILLEEGFESSVLNGIEAVIKKDKNM